MGFCRRSPLFLLGIFCLFASCKKKHHVISKGFYYWKTIYKPTQYELARLHQLGVQKMYVRLFDVDEDIALKRAMPVAPIRMAARDTGFVYVPVVFITQKALIGLSDSGTAGLAKSICNLVTELCGQAAISPNELQIDCDWTSGTKDKYFSLLRQLRTQPFMQGKTLSCTIRLNQVKYTAHNGIPPVDRGLMMCYGMGTLKKTGPLNSILDVDDAKDYLKHMDTYPVPMDMALPVFDWCLLFHDGLFKGIMRDVAADDVMRNSHLFKLKEGNEYICLQDTGWMGYKLKANDVVRVERPGYKDILSIAEFSSQRIRNSDMNVIFFDLDSITLSKFSNNDLEAIYGSYR